MRHDAEFTLEVGVTSLLINSLPKELGCFAIVANVIVRNAVRVLILSEPADRLLLVRLQIPANISGWPIVLIWR